MVVYLFVVIQIYNKFSGFLLFFTIIYNLSLEMSDEPHKISHRYVEYQEWEKENNCIKETERKEDKVMTEADNKFSKRVISYGIFLTGAAIALLGGLAEKGKILVIAVGIALVLLALWLYPKKERK